MGIQIKYKQGAFRAIRTSPETVAEVNRRAQRVAATAGAGYGIEAGVSGGRGRARAIVRPMTARAMRDNSRRNTLLRSLDAAKG